jgi:cytochrome c peroxidase
LPTGFRIDRVVVVQGTAFASDALATGSVNVFQKIFFRRLSLRSESTSAVDFSETTTAPPLLGLIPDIAAETEAARTGSSGATSSPLTQDSTTPLLANATAAASPGSSVPLDVLISQGARAFNEETFDGNGRTCATCHPASNNFTIDPAFIATLPGNDPLFVAEFNPALSQLERPQLMRQFGLILENLDGLSDPTNKFVMRGVPHTLGLQASLDKDSSMGTGAPTQMTGWSADGAPSTGSLRDFAIGAVIQHFTKSLARKEHRDFELPSEHQLDALEAFQLSLGRTADMDLSKITFVNADLNTGKGLFINGGGDPAVTGTCNFCHTNAGALSAGLGNQNRNFNTNVEAVTHPARAVQTYPVDGGFGQLPANSDGSFGNRAFNTPSLLEAADTPPFFHNNVALTLEEAVGFYSGDEFNNRPNVAQFNFDSTQNQQIANFLRGMNTLQNINVARRELLEVLLLSGNPQREVRTRLQTAADETQDATEVLTGAKLYPLAVKELAAAKAAIEQALKASDPTQRRSLVQQGAARLLSARNAVAAIAQ